MADGEREGAGVRPEAGPPLPTPGAPEKAAVRSMFDRIAPRYDLLNHVLSAGVDKRWRRICVGELGLREGAHVLDLCTGTGDLLIEALLSHESNRGIGIDLSGEMLSRGLEKLRRRGLGCRSALALGDAERLPFREGVFDAAMVAFGIRNVGEVVGALKEVHRALRPGGRLAVLEFQIPRGLLGSLYRFYFTRVLPRIGGLVSGDRGAYAYLPASVATFPAPESFGALMEQAGFLSVRWRTLTAGIATLHLGDKAGGV